MVRGKGNYNKYDTYIFFLIVSLVFGNIGGALMAVRVLAILLIPALLKKYKGCKDYIRNYFVFFVFFYAFCLLSILWTADRTEALKELIYFPIHFLLFAEILVFSRFAKNPLKTISVAWLLSTLLTLIVAVWEFSTNSHLSVASYIDDDELFNIGGILIERPYASVTFGNFNGYVVYLCFAMPFLYYYVLNNYKNTKKLIFSLIALFTSIFVIIANASRGGLLSLGIMAMLFFVMTKRNKYKLFILLVSTLLVVYFVIPRLESLFFVINAKSEDGGLLEDQGRIVIWMVALRVFSNYLFMGSGVGSIAAAMKAINPNTINITHNMFLEILVQYGIVFFLFFISYLLKLFRQSKKTEDRSIKILLYMALLALPIYSIIDSGYLLNPIVYVAFSCFTVYAYYDVIRLKESNKVNENPSDNCLKKLLQ